MVFVKVGATLSSAMGSASEEIIDLSLESSESLLAFNNQIGRAFSRSAPVFGDHTVNAGPDGCHLFYNELRSGLCCDDLVIIKFSKLA